MTDSEILALFQARDESALQAVSEKYRACCKRVSEKYLQSSEDAEECVNDVMMKLWKLIPPTVPQNLEAFIVTVTRRTALDYLRRQKADKRGGDLFAHSLDDLAETVPAQESVEDTVQERLLTEAVEHFLDTLSEDAQTIFVERYRNGTKPKDIAQLFGLSGGHVRKSLMQTRRKLEQYLTEEGLL